MLGPLKRNFDVVNASYFTRKFIIDGIILRNHKRARDNISMLRKLSPEEFEKALKHRYEVSHRFGKKWR
jgi:hypothetical protein